MQHDAYVEYTASYSTAGNGCNLYYTGKTHKPIASLAFFGLARMCDVLEIVYNQIHFNAILACIFKIFKACAADSYKNWARGAMYFIAHQQS